MNFCTAPIGKVGYCKDSRIGKQDFLKAMFYASDPDAKYETIVPACDWCLSGWDFENRADRVSSIENRASGSTLSAQTAPRTSALRPADNKDRLRHRCFYHR